MNPHRGSDFNEFLAKENLMTPTPRTDAIAHRGLGSVAYIAEMTSFARLLERELATEREQLAANHEATRLMGKWLEAERALADRLAEALNESTEGFGDRMSCEESCQCAGRRIVKVNKEALAAWKEARSA